MENPATWGKAEEIVNDVILAEWDQQRREEFTVGLSLTRQITDALRAAGLLIEEVDDAET